MVSLTKSSLSWFCQKNYFSGSLRKIWN